MDINPNGSEEYYQYLREMAEHERDESQRQRDHAERMKLLDLGLSKEQRDKRRDEMAHREQMKSLELGIVPNMSRMPLAVVCAAIGAGVPVGVSLMLMKASLLAPNFDQQNWRIAPILGLPAIFLAGILAWRGLLARGEPARVAVAERIDKGELDPDAYDVVGSRG